LKHPGDSGEDSTPVAASSTAPGTLSLAADPARNTLCGASLYTKRYAAGHHYICGAVPEARGTCNARPIPAVEAERAVIGHLWAFIANIFDWLEERAGQRSDERDRFAKSIAEQRARLRKLDIRSERAHEQHDRLLDADDHAAADGALRKALAIDEDRDHLAATIRRAEEQLEAWPVAPDVDAANAFLRRLYKHITDRIQAGDDVREVNAALRDVLESAELHVCSHADCKNFGKLHGTFRLRVTDDVLDGTLPEELMLFRPGSVQRRRGPRPRRLPQRLRVRVAAAVSSSWRSSCRRSAEPNHRRSSTAAFSAGCPSLRWRSRSRPRRRSGRGRRPLPECMVAVA
jgi:hypothetical protein